MDCGVTAIRRGAREKQSAHIRRGNGQDQDGKPRQNRGEHRHRRPLRADEHRARNRLQAALAPLVGIELCEVGACRH